MEYRFEILKILYEKRFNKVDLRPEITDWINDGHSRELIADALIKLRKKHFIIHSSSASLTARKNNIYRDEQLPIITTITSEGVEEYIRLERHYHPANATIQNKEKEKPKWLTLKFYGEETIKLVFKGLLGVIATFIVGYFGCHLFDDKNLETPSYS